MQLLWVISFRKVVYVPIKTFLRIWILNDLIIFVSISHNSYTLRTKTFGRKNFRIFFCPKIWVCRKFFRPNSFVFLPFYYNPWKHFKYCRFNKTTTKKYIRVFKLLILYEDLNSHLLALKGNSGQNFFFKKLHSSYRALKCQKNPFCFILITFFVQKLLKF